MWRILKHFAWFYVLNLIEEVFGQIAHMWCRSGINPKIFGRARGMILIDGIHWPRMTSSGADSEVYWMLSGQHGEGPVPFIDLGYNHDGGHVH